MSNSGKDIATVIRIHDSKHADVQFQDGTICSVQVGNLKKGSFKNPYRKRKYGQCIGIPKIKETDKKLHKHLYAIWNAMIHRCYRPTDAAYKSYGGKGIHVSERWLCYENFSEDVIHLPGFDRDGILSGFLELDKDYLQQDIQIDKKVYSKETCCFIPKRLNESIRSK